jgi:tetratricopeptide (TPR) repeat protein
MKATRLLLSVFLFIFYSLWFNLAIAEDFMAKGRDLEARTLYGPAIAEYQRAIKEDPANAAEAHYRIGVLSNKLGNTEGAAKEFHAALQANPNYAEARHALAAFYINRGVSARQQKRLDEALHELQEAVTIDPGSSTAHLELGQVYEENGRGAEAVQEYQAAVNADPRNVTAQLRLGQGYNAQKQYEQAIPAFKAVLENNPDRAEAYAGLGVASFHLGQKDEAKQAFNQAMRKYLVAGRRDLALQVKNEADALMPPPVAQGTKEGKGEKGKR